MEASGNCVEKKSSQSNPLRGDSHNDIQKRLRDDCDAGTGLPSLRSAVQAMEAAAAGEDKSAHGLPELSIDEGKKP